MSPSALYLQTPLGLDPSKPLFTDFVDLLTDHLKDSSKTTSVEAILCQSLELVTALSEALKDFENAPSLVLNANLLEDNTTNTSNFDALHFLHEDAFSLYKQVVQKKNDPTHEYGVGPLGSKDDIITVGGMDADYVAIPASNTDLIDWASTYTTIPVVVWGAQTMEDVTTYIKSDVGFVMPAPWFWKNLKTHFSNLD